MMFRKSSLAISLALTLTTVTSQTVAAPTVAMIDLGFPADPGLNGRILPGSFNFLDNNADVSDADNHGTITSLIVANGAPSADLLQYKVGTVVTGSQAISDAAVLAAAARSDVRIINKSDGAVASLGALQAAASAGKIFITKSGNDSASNPTGDAVFVPSLGGLGIIAGAVNRNGTILSISNRAGSLAQFFVVAPGYTNGLPTSREGTSFAAPVVSSIAAQILAVSPFLTGAQVVEIILNSAIDLGDPGTDGIYGRGLADLASALAATGQVSIGTGSTAGGGGSSIAGGALVLAAAVAVALVTKSKNIDKTLVLDEYQRSYQLDLTKLITTRSDTSEKLRSIFSQLKSNTRVVPFGKSANTSSYAVLSAFENRHDRAVELLDPFSYQDDRNPTDYALSIFGKPNANSSYEFGLNTNSQRRFGALASLSAQTTTTSFLTSKTFSAPYFGFSDAGFSGKINFNESQRFGLSLGLANTDERRDFGLQSNAALVEGTFKLNNRSTISLQGGQLLESGSLFGGSSGGAFSVNNSNTLSFGISGTYKLNNAATLIGHYSEGYTKVNQRENSLLHNFSDIRSNAFGVGLIIDEPFSKHDQAGIAFSQPLRITQGSVSLDTPFGRDFDGNIYTNSEIIDLAPDGTEHTFEAYYRFNIKKKTDVFTYIMYQHQPENNNRAGNAATVYMTLKHQF
ncbi:MAG: S8 family serine peptidase [Gammaproteobacteria bacterium]|nr:S8 family serine peptidase [Gammaproteobacteria bacterium]